jgi:hypothetical protein
MSITTNVAKRVRGYGADKSASGTTARHKYQVVSDGTLTELTVLNVAGMPRYGDAHPGNSKLRVAKLTPDCQGHPNVWIVTVEYEYKQDAQAHPWEEQPKSVAWDSWEVSEALNVGTEAAPAVPTNSAGDAFDPAPMIARHYPKVVIARSERFYDPEKGAAFTDSLNDADIRVAGMLVKKWCGLLVKFSGTQQERNGEQYAEVQYEILVNPRTWKIRLVNQGFRALSGGLPYLIDKDGGLQGSTNGGKQLTPDPWPLKADGTILARGQPLVFKEFDGYKTKAWADLELPQKMPTGGRRTVI